MINLYRMDKTNVLVDYLGRNTVSMGSLPLLHEVRCLFMFDSLVMEICVRLMIRCYKEKSRKKFLVVNEF